VCSPAGAPAGIFPPDGSCKGAAERGNHTADLAERYGWINRALHAAVDHFAKSLDHRIAGFRAAGRLAVKDPINAIALAEAEDFRRHSDLFSEGGPGPKSQSQIQAAMNMASKLETERWRWLGCLATGLTYRPRSLPVLEPCQCGSAVS
jgi:hypothetical protein